MVYGDGKNYLVALIVPSKEFNEKKEKVRIIRNSGKEIWICQDYQKIIKTL